MRRDSPLFPSLKINCPVEGREKVTRREENEKVKEEACEGEGVRRALQRRERGTYINHEMCWERTWLVSKKLRFTADLVHSG